MNRLLLPDSHVPRTRWHGMSVSEHIGTIGRIAELLPTFEIRPFELAGRANSSVNPYLSLIVRKQREGEEEMPVGVVSKQYQLIQHRQVLDNALEGLKKSGIDPDELSCELRITEFGERMALNLLFPSDDRYSFHVNGDDDTMRLRLQCFNSVDGSTKCIALLGWYRFVCSNGMVVGITKVDFRRRHDPSLEIENIEAVLRAGLSAVRDEKELYRVWLKTNVPGSDLCRWVDGPLREKWGVKLAARTLHIAKTGYDAAFAKPFEKGKPSEKTMTPTKKVPGAWHPANHTFAISQTLSWLAKERRDIQEQVDRMREIPSLMGQLMTALIVTVPPVRLPNARLPGGDPSVKAGQG